MIKFRNSKHYAAVAMLFISGLVVFMVLFGIVGTAITEDEPNLILPLIIGGLVLIGIWLLYLFFIFVIGKTITVDENEITIKRFGKTRRVIRKENICGITYHKLYAANFISPHPNTCALIITVRNEKRQDLSTSLKVVNAMIALDYLIEIL
ncbi:MAG: hypothetical protein FWH03_07110 [Firmicutes bacterium]|nr:hypothetical protein [Bacillota bacterium]